MAAEVTLPSSIKPADWKIANICSAAQIRAAVSPAETIASAAAAALSAGFSTVRTLTQLHTRSGSQR
uniref:Uncharacterized protein n=1 Tax=Mycolicibacterium sp. CBMA 213 TaxID=1968788 RepID=A0A343VRE4_9MYCO|nr:hypothetical protein B5P44_p00173 [Mycolicibacterium sp. CBMA 213]